MSVSIIIVNYNAGDWLARCLNSVVELAEVDHVHVIDNASRDISLDLIQPLLEKHTGRLTLIENRKNIGFAAANNQILHQFGKGRRALLNDDLFGSDFILLLNPDCEMNPDVLPAMLAAFVENPKLGLAGCVIRNEDGSLQKTCRRNFPTPMTALTRMLQLQRLGLAKNFDLGDQPLPNELTLVEAISGAFMMVRVSAMQEVGILDEDYFMHCEDLDWCKRFAIQNWQVGFVPTVSVVHAKGVSSKSRPVGVLWTLHKGMLRFFDKFYRAQYSVFTRMLVKIGIYASFVLRVAWSMLKKIVFQGRKNQPWLKRMR